LRDLHPAAADQVGAVGDEEFMQHAHHHTLVRSPHICTLADRHRSVRERTEHRRGKPHNQAVSTMSASRDRLQSLAGCGDPDSLRVAMGELCAEFGKLTRIEIFTLAEPDRRRAFCLLRLESPAQERRLVQALGASFFGDDLLLVVDLAKSKQTKVAREALC
jgi:hypothetical protein